MKKFLFLVLFALTVSFASAQDDVTKFLGIPVDGPKSEMIKKLQEKGFKYDKMKDCLTGTFNGEDVLIQIETNGSGKVWRICISDKDLIDEIGIKIRFNTLLSQFEEKVNYEKIRGEEISDDEKILYHIDDKRYDALFYQKSSGKPNRNSCVWFMIDRFLTRYRILMFYENEKNNPSNGADL